MAGSHGSARSRRTVGIVVIALVVVTVGMLLAVDGPRFSSGTEPAEPAPAATDSATAVARIGPFAARFPFVTRTAVDLPGRRLDLYVPRAESARVAAERYPLTLLVTDPAVPPGQYEQFAHDIAGYGLAVVVVDGSLLGVADDLQRWSARVARDRNEYLNGTIGPRVAFVVTHGEGKVPTELRTSVDAVVQVAPAKDAVAPEPSPLVVCAGGEAAACPVPPGGRHVVVDGATRGSVTDEGIRGPRRLPTIDERRARVIAAFAGPAAWWLRAAVGDPVGERYVSERVPTP